MISISELQDIAASEKEAEDKAAEAKRLKDLATYRERLKEAHPEFIKYIQNQIIIAMKRNQKRAELYSADVEKIFATMKTPLPYEVLYYMVNETRIVESVFDVAMKEEAEIARKELLEAGVKGFKKGGGYVGAPTIYVLF